ncbi:MAG: hypothetical protein QOC92_4713 [Acidimicrobiaceae bacterium]
MRGGLVLGHDRGFVLGGEATPVGRGAGSTDPDPLVSGVCLLLLTYASPVTPYKPTPIAGVSHDILTGRAEFADDGRRPTRT